MSLTAVLTAKCGLTTAPVIGEAVSDKPKTWFIPRENLDRAQRSCDLGDSVNARIYMYPHKDDGHIPLVEKSAYDREREINRVLEQAYKDADFVLAGSRAIEGQDDNDLEARENALMRFFETQTKLEKLRRER